MTTVASPARPATRREARRTSNVAATDDGRHSSTTAPVSYMTTTADRVLFYLILVFVPVFPFKSVLLSCLNKTVQPTFIYVIKQNVCLFYLSTRFFPFYFLPFDFPLRHDVLHGTCPIIRLIQYIHGIEKTGKTLWQGTDNYRLGQNPQIRALVTLLSTVRVIYLSLLNISRWLKIGHIWRKPLRGIDLPLSVVLRSPLFVSNANPG